MKIIVLLFLMTFAGCLGGCGSGDETHTDDGRLIVNYWEHWTGFEKEAMQAVVDDFNASQDRLFVKMLPVSQLEQKIILATAGGRPPDVVGLWARNLASFGEKGALVPLGSYMRAAGIKQADYIPKVWDQCQFRGYTWGLPTTPASLALHWNKRLFREAGLDPERPPQSLAELDAMNERLTVVSVRRGGATERVRYDELTDAEKAAKDFGIIQLGFTPSEPGWWKEAHGFWFGAHLWDGDRSITANTPENVAAFAWYASFPEKFGVANLKKFGANFGQNFASPQNPFMDERIAMVLQGVWMYNFIDQFAPNLEWAAAPFPSVDPVGLPDVTFVDCDVICIPKGAKNPDAAFEFIAFVQRQDNIEKLNLGQRKFSPRAEYSADFLARHPHPYIKVFIDLANSPNARILPAISVWVEYRAELMAAADRAFGGVATARQALDFVQDRMQWKFDRTMKRWDLTGEARLEEWASAGEDAVDDE